MAIEGPLRELGIHDVFQLLDLSRKTGTLTVTSQLRDNEGVVLFENGKVISASIKSNPHRIGDLLVRSGRLTDADLAMVREAQAKGDRRRFGEILVGLGLVTSREMERQMRLQIEAVVFELMSWSEGHFRFTEGMSEDALRDASAPLGTESLLMEGARRIDEWSRIADRVPNLSVIPDLAPGDADHPALLDLLPQEWKVLAMIDGQTDLRSIAATLSMSEFDVARIVYGMVSTGVVLLRQPTRASVPVALPSEPRKSVHQTPMGTPPSALRRGAEFFRAGRLEDGIATWSAFVESTPKYPAASALREAVVGATKLVEVLEREVPRER
ncbi:DUF4388 domain-containing protein [Pseudogemmatithrix spongiicola]|uniref:DUF4388 domain-containing protein n=1 Tax=Pseudogemmatithrix spongiicola TaxID=3062599 RepID=A0AA49JZ17_9BACT|nr:DUF4388 domain-containing protein [Gemmatimonadaceae bacterium 'strain 138']WKW14890.1 DUF4388 domain-containing protein [Gemmatimonadaceae bacterium 'strain 318']